MRVFYVRPFVRFGLLLAATLLVRSVPALADGTDCQGIATDKGAVSGVLSSNGRTCSYKGIPFAAPPVGGLRWAAPTEAAPWSGARDASEYGPTCVQPPLGLSSLNALSSGKETPTEPTGQEDCLYLNVWHAASSDGEKRPVMVFIHGGSFLIGAGSWDLYDGTSMAGLENVAVVTINYRLGPFGFLAHPALTDSQGRHGDWGLLDQIAALEWVKRNIAAFGGDPDNVTVFGESAGGMSVGALLISPLARGLFHKAIVQSGPAYFIRDSKEKAFQTGSKAAAALGCGNGGAECLRAVSATDLMARLNVKFMSAREETEQGFQFSPHVDGLLVPSSPYRALSDGGFDPSIPVMMGFNRDEATLFTMGRTIDTPEALEAELKKDVEMADHNFGIRADADALKNLYPAGDYKRPKDAYNAMMTDMIFGCPAISMSRLLTEKGAAVYLYHFAQAPDEKGLLGGLGVFHAAELPFVFGNFSFMGMSVDSKKNRSVGRRAIALWTSFARDGKPISPGVPEWPVFRPETGDYLQIDASPFVGTGLKEGKCGVFEKAYRDMFMK